MPETVTETQSLTDLLDPARAAALHVTLNRPGPPPGPGDPIPPFWRWIYFWEPLGGDSLGADGHPKTGLGLIPDLGLPQRMWAGGRLDIQAPLRLGQTATKTTSLAAISEKTGRTGRLGFVTLRHEIRQNDTRILIEEQDLVYRAPPDDRRIPASPPARTDETASREARFTTTQLFRYSALTFNGHRIHYDLDYARTVEGYDGLVVHGPLLAQLLMDLAEDQLGTLRNFSFRATSALMHFETAMLCWHEDGDLWVRGPDGRLCMQARAR